ncbi:MAG: sporulation initiation factor Spo0A C-terminal domain-containing protein [Ruminococcus flavefaciens]|nr:sporulation initiation factor Spo0A C-terminal domain-containing protein [Ruminococcus flavefaciens]
MVGIETRNSTRQITNILFDMGMSPSYRGFKYVRSAIQLVLDEDNRWMDNFCKEVYSAVAEMYGTTPSRVERSMRTVIQSLSPCNELVSSLFVYARFGCTNKQFVYTIAEYISTVEKEEGA